MNTERRSVLAGLKAGEVVDIAIYDTCHGKARIEANDTENELLKVQWLEEPYTCYENQTLIMEALNEISYQEIAYECLERVAA